MLPAGVGRIGQARPCLGACRSDRVPPPEMLRDRARKLANRARGRRGLPLTAPLALLLLVLGGCQLKHPTDNVVRGKQLFVSKCGACHTLSHASTSGTVGPNL